MNRQPAVKERLYHLLPRIYRQRDAENGEALRALMAVLERESAVVEADIETLYDNGFVDTCQEWVLPYIGELLGVRDLVDENSIVTSQRRRIANTIRYRRRKGIGAVLENVVYDVTGWHTRFEEFLGRISMTQSLANLRLDRGRVVDFRDRSALQQTGGPFDSWAHLLDMRSIHKDRHSSAHKRGKYGIHNVGLFLWRLQSYEAAGQTAQAASDHAGCFFFHPLGLDIPLFNRAHKSGDLTALSQAANLPVSLTRDLLEKDLNRYKEQYIDSLESHRLPSSTYYGPTASLNVVVKGQPVPPMKVISADLGDWRRDGLQKPESISGTAVTPHLAVDVELGRLAFSDELLKGNPVREGDVVVKFHYGFSADLGGGPYDRRAAAQELGSATLRLEVAKDAQLNNLRDAVQRWEKHCLEHKGAGTPIKGIITMMDNGVYRGDIGIRVPENAQLAIEAVDGKNPYIRPDSRMTVTGPEREGAIGNLTIDGIRLDKPLLLQGRVFLKVKHSTILSARKGDDKFSCMGITAGDKAHDLSIEVSRSILGPLRVSAARALSIAIKDSIIDENATGIAIGPDTEAAGWSAPCVFERATLFGKVRVQELIASETIFSEELVVQRRQVGYMRFCYAPPQSQTPIKFRCQPGNSAAAVVQPCFSSTRYGNPAYAQLSQFCPEAIRTGAQDGSEIGVFEHLRQPQREENLRSVIDEYLKQDLQAGFFYET